MPSQQSVIPCVLFIITLSSTYLLFGSSLAIFVVTTTWVLVAISLWAIREALGLEPLWWSLENRLKKNPQLRVLVFILLFTLLFMVVLMFV